MQDLSKFESRTGKLTCKPHEVFDFVTDIRNFRQFVPEGTIDELQIDRESCSFNVPPLGNVTMYLHEKEHENKVVYNGTVFQSNEFSLILDINQNTSGKAEVILKLEARLNPLLKMMAAKYIDKFLETLIDEMERFRNWQNSIA
jgi:carbon monoxide dehydrogenase subunit G